MLSYGVLDEKQKVQTSQALESDSFPAPPRDVKIAQFRALQATESKLTLLQSTFAAAADDEGVEANDNDDDVRGEIERHRVGGGQRAKTTRATPTANTSVQNWK